MKIAAIVEGHAECEAVPVLIRRVASELLGVAALDAVSVQRTPRSKLMVAGELERSVELQANKVGAGGGILVLLDADDDCPASLGPTLLARAKAARPDRRIEVVLANREFEAWFLAAVESVRGKRTIRIDADVPADPETVRDTKGWLSERMSRPYRETLDQPALSAVIDLAAVRARSPSFDKLVRAVGSLLDVR